ncbi:zinc metalloprotease HtpX [Geodermatophilus sp. URMC 61]|uniref:zinc metalloprotease HtpX n=1 Tax=Geodermatophilus sp. URMC 61 TaxID=3423411 RepID=UPI00406D24E1
MLDPGTLRRQGLRNVAQAVLLLGGLVGTAGVLAWVLFGPTGLLWALVVGALVGALRPRVPTRTLLAVYGAVPVGPGTAPRLVRMVQELSERAGLASTPTLYYVSSTIPNAFAAGRGDDAAIAVSDGLLRILTAREVAAVLAHEVSHVRSGDTVVMSLSDTVGRFVQALSYVGVLSILITLPMTLGGDPELLLLSLVLIALPTVVTLAQLALSRTREYDADLEGATLTGDPEALASALESLERSAGRIWERLMVRRGRVPDPLLLRTHPSTPERARRLRELVPHQPQRVLGDDGPAPPPLDVPTVVGPPRLRFPGIRW